MEHYLNISSFKHLSLTSKQNSFSVSWASLFSKSQLESSVPMKILCVSLCGCNFPQSPFKQNILRSFLIGVSKRKNAVGALCSHEKMLHVFFGPPFDNDPSYSSFALQRRHRLVLARSCISVSTIPRTCGGRFWGPICGPHSGSIL